MEKRPTLLAIHAHPDDESSKGSGTMAKYAGSGVRVVLVCCTGGEEGDILNPRMDRPGIKDQMAEIRQAELETACDILGVERIYHLGYRDSGMPGAPSNQHPDAFCNADPDEAVGRLVEVIRAERPEVVLSYDESRGYEHPDHIRVHEWGRAAFEAAGRGDMYPDKGSPWEPLKLYYFATFSSRRFGALEEAAKAAAIDHPFFERLKQWREEGEFEEPNITTSIDVGDFIELRSKALLAHATQIDPDGDWFAIPDELQRKAYPWEDFTLVESHVHTELPEDDLFAGVFERRRAPHPPAG
ncbi:MAG TPA: mycothiol conjugate amidase Mca [Actinomycetota bacterium]|jgi:mycothiol S-conjugate amidase|nr:mycothiol conjugate amidase Mca [Actinomycetota bacterium]